MSKKIILYFSGWAECDPDRVNFVSVSDEDIPEVITGREWLALPEYDEDAICRDDYVLESTVDAQATAIDGDYDDYENWDLRVEDE